MQLEMGEFFEDINDALQSLVTSIGGYKKLGPELRPELPQDQAANWLRDCLNPARREKLSPEQVLFLLRRAREEGCHAAMFFIAFATGYKTQPVEPETQEAQLQERFVEAVGTLHTIQAQLERLQRVRRAG